MLTIVKESNRLTSSEVQSRSELLEDGLRKIYNYENAIIGQLSLLSSAKTIESQERIEIDLHNGASTGTYAQRKGSQRKVWKGFDDEAKATSNNTTQVEKTEILRRPSHFKQVEVR